MNAPPPGSWEHSVDERDLTVEQWKELIYKEVVDYELTHNTHTDGSPRIPCLQVTTIELNCFAQTNATPYMQPNHGTGAANHGAKNCRGGGGVEEEVAARR